MILPPLAPARNQAFDAVISIAGLSSLRPVVVGGSRSRELFLALQRYGFARVVLASSCRSPHGKLQAAMVADDSSYRSLDLSVAQVSRLLTANATIAISFKSIKSVERDLNRRMANKLEQLGFRIEAGKELPQGFVLSARRRDFGVITKAA